MDDAYRFGIEEEYFLADAATRGTPERTLDGFHHAVHSQLPKVERELLQSQVEVSTPPSTSFGEAATSLRRQRASLAAIGREHGILVFAAGTHPVARWSRQQHTRKQRYDGMMRELGMLGRRNVVCGMHVHVEVPRPEARVDLMNRLMPTMPLLLALSVSSPFWQGQRTGLAGYRLCVFGEAPRTGLPDLFAGPEDYARYVEIMTRAGSVEDASHLWWTLRPSIHFPTLELRVADSCTSVEHTLAIAALYRCLVRFADRRPEWNRSQTGGSRPLAPHNMWPVQPDGTSPELIDAMSGAVMPFADHLDAALSAVAEDADALGCQEQIDAARAIVSRGTSAARQTAVFADARSRGRSAREALSAVVDWLAQATTGDGADS